MSAVGDVNKRIDKIIEVAKPISLLIDRPKKHVSIIIRKNEIMSIGTNKFKTHPMAKKYGYRFDEVHSELDALLKYKGPKDNLKLFNFRFNSFGKTRMSKPCFLCNSWCSVIFDEIYYTTSTNIERLAYE